MEPAMMRIGAAFIALCMVIVAGSVGAALYLAAGLKPMEAAIAALAVLTSLAVYNAASGRMRSRDDAREQVADLARGTADLARQVGELGRRVIAVEAAANAATERAVTAAAAATEPLAAEIAELGTLFGQLAQSVAAHEASLAGGGWVPEVPAPAPPPPLAPAANASISSRMPAIDDGLAAIGGDELDQGAPERALSGRFKGMDQSDIFALIHDAIDANRIDLYLQPIVSLPQRKVRYYEAEPRLRTEDGALLVPDEFLSFAQSGGLMPRIDNLMLLRCVQVVRRLTARNREIGLFCGISGATLLDPEFLPQLTDFMQANRALAPSLVLEFEQATIRSMSLLENESLTGFAELGFRFSLNHLVDLRLDPRELAERGVRFVKVPGSLLLNRVGAVTDIHPADFSDLLGRFGIDLIAEKIESESMVVDLLDYDVRFGQGGLFSAARAVRADAMHGLGEPAARREPAATNPARMQAEAPPPAGPLPVPTANSPIDPQAATEKRFSALRQIARGITRRVSPG